MNKAFATKWIYQYVNDKGSLWGKVVRARSNGDANGLLLALRNRENKSVLLNFVELAIGRSGLVRAVNPQLGILIGNGHNTNFLG